LTADEQDKIQELTHQALGILARDQVTRVRQILSEALKDVAHAPPEVIRALAFDLEQVVAGPVLEFSPVLTDEDILEIIEHGAAPGRLSSISKRENVSENIVDAIVMTDNEAAIALLLSNESAQIREETLDQVIEHAENKTAWHLPLVRRPKLSIKAASRIASFVADNLLNILSERADLSADVLEKVRHVVKQRLGDDGDAEVRAKSPVEPDEDVKTPSELAYERALQLDSQSKLDQVLIEKALVDDEREFAMAGIAVRAGITMSAMRKLVASRSAKGLVSIAWKAGLTAPQAEKFQIKLAQLPITKVLKATSDGEFPMSEGDMEWQFDFITELN